MSKSTFNPPDGSIDPQSTGGWQCKGCGMWYIGTSYYTDYIDYTGENVGPFCISCWKSQFPITPPLIYNDCLDADKIDITVSSTERDNRIEELEAEVKRLSLVDMLYEELLEHEQLTHKVLGEILGTDDGLEVLARRVVERIKELETTKEPNVEMTNECC